MFQKAALVSRLFTPHQAGRKLGHYCSRRGCHDYIVHGAPDWFNGPLLGVLARLDPHKEPVHKRVGVIMQKVHKLADAKHLEFGQWLFMLQEGNNVVREGRRVGVTSIRRIYAVRTNGTAI